MKSKNDFFWVYGVYLVLCEEKCCEKQTVACMLLSKTLRSIWSGMDFGCRISTQPSTVSSWPLRRSTAQANTIISLPEPKKHNHEVHTVIYHLLSTVADAMEESHLQTEAGSVAKHLSNREMALKKWFNWYIYIYILIILSLIGSTMPAKGFRLIYWGTFSLSKISHHKILYFRKPSDKNKVGYSEFRSVVPIKQQPQGNAEASSEILKDMYFLKSYQYMPVSSL